MQLPDIEKEVLCELFLGCLNYAKVVDVVLNGYYCQNGQHILQSERNIYKGLLFDYVNCIVYCTEMPKKKIFY